MFFQGFAQVVTKNAVAVRADLPEHCSPQPVLLDQIDFLPNGCLIVVGDEDSVGGVVQVRDSRGRAPVTHEAQAHRATGNRDR